MRSTFKVLFYLKRNAPKKNGLVPVMYHFSIYDNNTKLYSRGQSRKEACSIGIRFLLNKKYH